MNHSSLKILLVVHAFFPRYYHGTERYTLELARSLQTMGHKVVVVTVSDHSEDSTGLPWIEHMHEGVRVLAIDLLLLPHSSFRSSYERPEIDDVFRRILWEEKPDLVHCWHILNLGATVIGLAKEAKVPVVFSLTDFFGICWTNRLATLQGRPCDGPQRNGVNCIKDFYSEGFKQTNSKTRNLLLRLGRFAPDFFWVLFQKYANSNLGRNRQPLFSDLQLRNERMFKYYKQVDVYIAATDFLRKAYVAHGFAADRFRKITFGITQPTDSESIALEKRYADLGDKTPFVFGFIGQVARHKGIHLLIEAFQRVQIPRAELHIYGALDQESNTMNQILTACESDHRIKCLGIFPGNEIYSKIASIHVLCIPSQWAENAPLVLLNGLASKTFLIVSQGEGLAEFVQDEIQGIVFETGSVKSLAWALKRVFHQREELFEKCNALPGYTFAPSEYAREVGNIYRELLTDSSTPSFAKRLMAKG
jgi:glycosyltransferase involved in cell wall biosynthesis